MDDKFKKPYDSAATEPRIYEAWEKSGYFNPDNLPGERSEPFTVTLPPPNVTGVLHLGHAYEDSLQDTVVRFQRMRGKKTLWVPGTDSAAIATQARVEKDLQKEGRAVMILVGTSS
jgi:valyl-tRNA synthetase